MKSAFAAFALSSVILSSCSQSPQEEAEDALEDRAEASALSAGAAPVALGMTEAELLDADIYGPGDIELGEVAEVRRGMDGTVDALLMEVEDSDPDRFVEIPLDGLSTRPDGDDFDLISGMTAEDIAALPDVDITATPAPEDPPA